MTTVDMLQRSELFAPAVEEYVGDDDQPADLPLDQVREGVVEATFRLGLHDVELKPEHASC